MTDTVKSISKGLAVLSAVNDLAPAKVMSLVSTTGLPKPTLIRCLNTLIEEEYVVRRTTREGGGYVPTPKVRLLASAFARGSIISQVSQPVLNDLCELVKWPSDLLVRDGLSMIIEATNREIAPIRLNRFEQSRFPILLSSGGQVYLAQLPERERTKIIKSAIAQNASTLDHQPIKEEVIERMIDQVNAQGFAFRDYDTPIEGTRATSIAINSGGRPIASLTLIILRDVVHPELFRDQILPQMHAAAANIVKDYELHAKATDG